MPDTDRRNHHDIGYGEDFYRALDPHYHAPAALPEAKSNNDAGYGEDFYRTLDPDAPATQKSPAVKTPLQNAPEQRGFFKEAASALASGAVSTAEALTSTAEMIGVPGAERASSYLRGVQESEALVRPDYLRSGTVLDEPARLADWRWWTRTVGENIPNALAMLVPAGAVSKLGQIGKLGTLLKGSATARRAAALGAGFSASFPLEAGSAYSSAKQEMSATGQYDADTIERIATAEGLVAGTTNAIIELLPIDSLLFKQSGGDRLLRRILRQAYIEGGTETVQEAVNILVEQYGHAPDATLKDQIGRVIEAGLAGGVIGGGFGATIGTAEHRAKTNAYLAIAHKTDLDEDIVRWKQEDLPDKNIAELVSARLDDYRRSAAPDETTQIPAKIDAAEMVSFVLYGSGRFQPDRSGAKKKAAVLRAMGMKPKTPPAEMPMTTSAADGKAVITEEQRAQAQNERAAANRKAQGKTLFDAVASEDLAETQAIEQARQDDEARRNAETVRLAAAEQASRDKAVADAQSRQDALIARLAGADPQKQALVQDVLGLSERALLSAVQKELKLTVTPAGPGAYTVETPGGPQPADLFDLRQRLAEKRSADFTARQDEEAANAAAVRRMEEEQARKKREREAAAALDMSRRSLVASLSGPTPQQLAHLNANRQRLTPDEIARLDRWMKKDRDSAPVSPPPAPRPPAVISEEVNAAAKAAPPPKQDNGQDDEAALVDLMLSDVANARKGGELRTDDAGETIRDTAGIAWLTAANRAGADVTVKDAKTVLNKVKTGEDLTERQQRQLTAILDAMRAAGGAKVTQALSWAKKGYIPVDNRRIAVRDMVEGDSYVIDNEEFRVTDIDDAGNVTLKDGTIKKVRDGEMLTGVDFVKPVEGAEDFSGESFDDAMKRVESEAEPPQAPPVPESRKTPPASVAVTTGLKTKAPEKRDISQLAGDLAAGRIAPGKFTFPADVTPQEINEVWDDLSAAVENIAKKNEPFIRALHEEIDALGPARTAAIKAQKKALLDKIRALQDEADALDRKITNAFEGAQAQLLDTIIERAKAEGLFIDDAESEEVYELYSTLQEGRSHDPLFIDGKIPEDYVNTWTVPLAEQILDELRAQQPTGDAYPVPNSSGVYNEKQKKAEVISFPQNKAFDAAVYVLQVGPEEWISAEDVSLKTGSYAGQSSPLTKNPVFPTRKAALADALKTVQQFGESNARDASSPATDKSRKAAAQIAQWAEKQYLELYPPSQAPSQAVAVTTGLKKTPETAPPPIIKRILDIYGRYHYVDQNELQGDRTILKTYNSRGERLLAGGGIHRGYIVNQEDTSAVEKARKVARLRSLETKAQKEMLTDGEIKETKSLIAEIYNKPVEKPSEPATIPDVTPPKGTADIPAKITPQAEAWKDKIEADVKDGWYIHGRRGTDDLLSEFKKHEIFVSKEADVAEDYAGNKGSIWQLRPKKTANILDATDDIQRTEVVDRLKEQYESGDLNNGAYTKLSQEIDDEIESYGEGKAWERISESLNPKDIVEDEGFYSDTDFVNWLYENFEYDFVSTNRGGVAYNPDAFDLKKFNPNPSRPPEVGGQSVNLSTEDLFGAVEKAVTTGLKPKKAAALPPEMPIIRARLQHLKSLGVNTAGYDEWVKVMESGDAAALANEPPAQDTLRAINLTIAEEEKILKAQAQEKGFGAGNTLFTEDKAAKARAILKAKLSGAQLNAGIDPEILTAGIDLAGYYIEGGVRKFADFTAKMVEDIGEQIRPYLKSLYLAVRNYPGFDNAGMETEADIEKSLTAAAATDKIAAKGEKSHADSSDLDAGAAGNAPAVAASARQAEQNAGRLPEDVRAVVSGIEGQARREGSEVPQGVNLPAEIQAHAEQYLYHATYAEKIAGINAAGLDPTKSNQYIYGNDTTKRVYLSPDQELSLAFGDVLLRVRRSALNQKLLKEIARQGGQEVWYFDRIAPSLIERLTPRGEWAALSAQTEKIPQSVAVTTGAKTPKTKESPYMAAVGLISGGRADRAVARGYVFAYGPADAATQSEMVGLFSGLAADKLIEAGITIERKTPAAFKKGDRVVMKNGRHGEIIADESYTMIAATIFGGQRNVERYENYRVRTDAGAEFGMIKPEDLTKETEKPAEPVVPDIKLIDGHFNEPDRVLNRIALHQSNEQKKRASAQRARKQDNIDKLLEAAEKEKRIAAGLRARYDEWAAKYPDEAAKHAPAKTLPPIGQVHPSIREKYAAKPTAAAAKAYPDLTVSGHPKPVPDHPDASYVVHIRKPDLIPDTFRVVVSAQRAAGGGFLTQAGTGMTPEQAYDNALANYDRTIETRRSSTNQDAESVTNTTTPVDNEKTNDYNKIEQEAQDAPSDRHDTDETSSEDDRAGAQGPGTRDVSATSDERSTSGVSQGTRRADDEHVRGPVRGTLQAAIRHESDLSGTSPAPDFRTQPGVGRNNGDVADVQRSAAGERTDHVITPGAIDRTGSWFQTAKNNLDIIELAKKIQTENRPATPTEQALLARYTGFGASEIANRMFPGWAEAGEIQLWRADQKWKPLVERMQKLFSPAEIATAARSTQYAHYTSPAIIDSIYKALDGFGFPGGRVLEPGMGVGSFFGLMPESMRTTTKYTGIEMDGITAQIAKLLYPRQNIIEGDYTKAQFPNNYFDLAIGNPPYAKTMILADPDYKKLRLSLHDFFFVKSLDKIRPGGLMVFITSRYTMDKVDSRVRKILNEKSDLLGAVRLPQTAFAKNAGTEVVTDVIFLRKKVPGEKSAGMMWGEVAPVTTPEGDFRINEYYLAHPEMVLGDHSGRGTMQNSRDPQYTVLPREGNIEEAFAQAVTHLPKAVYSLIKAAPAVQEAAAIERDFNPQNKKEGGLYLSPNGQVMVTESGAGVPITAIAPKLSDKDRRWLTSYITLRDAVKQCQYDQLTDGDWESSLKELNRVYKAFKMAWGRINAFTITERKSTDEDGKEITIHLRKFANSRLLRLDVESPLVMALEKVTEDFQIADGPFLSSRTIKKPEPPQISTVADALAVSLNEKGRLDLAHIASLMGASEADVFEQLGDLVYDTPDKGIQLADAYLSGNVVKKLEEAKAAAKIDPKYERNVQALIASLPKPLTAKDITPSPGATWIPLPVYNDFLHEVLELPESAAADHSPADNQWTISGLPVQSQRGRASAWSSPDRGANEIFSAVLNNATLKVYKTEKVAGVEKTYLDPAATAQVNDIAKKMKIRFRNWVWENAGRAHELLNIYNSTRNNIVPRRFDGSHLTLPGVSLRFKLMPHQKNAIWRIIQDGNTYIAHAVGAGKTYEMVAAGMEMKRLSLISKPLYVVPNHMLQQFANEFQELYPLAHVMVADEENFHTTNRRRFMAQAALNNPDAIVITHSAFGLLKMKQENILPVRNDVVSEMQAALDDLEGDKKANRIRIKQMEARIEQTEQRFESMIAQGDNVITFEDMGVDFLFVDEAHQFRKLDFTTNRQAKGVDPSGSVRAMMLYIKTQWLDRQNPGRSHVFASGTPITNTMGELYTVMKFFDMDGLRRDGLDYFDSWAAEYGDMNSAPEMNAAGRYEIVDRFSRFVNVPELMSRVRSFMDVLTSSQLGAFVKRPKVRGGQPTIVVTPASPALKNYQTNVLLPRIESSKNWKPSKEEPGNPDPLINIITDGRLASIDMRFVAPGSPNDPDSKLNKYIDKIIEHYKETAGHTYLDPATGQKSPVRGAAQICFYNHGFGRGVASSRGFDARAWAMRRFKEAGIPVDEIAWIDDFDTAAKKEAVMKEVRNGHKRILIGSAKKMGTGMNVQTRLSHMTYLDPPWYPSDVEQPVGRILRQGNQNEEVGIFYFSTKGSYDATMWQMVTRKAKFIEDALAGGGARAIEDISESSLYEMAAALASGDERAIRLAGLRNEIEGLENLRSAHYHTQTNLQREKRLYEIGHPGKKAYVAKLEAAMQKVPFDLRYLSAQHPIKAKLGHRDYTDRKAFAQDLLAKIVALRNAGTAGTTPIGHFFGLELRVVQAQGGNTEVWDRSGQTELIPGKVVNQLQLRITDDVIYDVASDITDTSDAPGLVTRLTNRAKAVPSDLAQAKQSLEETETELKKINARLGAPFELARELEEKIAEAAQIDADLVREGQATAAAQQQQHTAPAQTPDQTPPDTSGPMLSLEETPIFFSQMSRVLQAKLPGSGTPEQYRSAIVSWANKGEFKADELKWSGLTDWLVAQKGKLAKQQVLDYLAANEVQLREVHLSDTPSDPQLDRLKNAFAQAEEGVRAIEQALGARPYMSGAPLRWMYRPDDEAPRNVPKQYFDTLDRWSEARLDLDDYQATHEGFFEEDEESTGRTQYSNQQLPGGKNYRELLLTLPEKKTVPTLKHSYRSAHWNTPNVLAHVRYNDRTDANGNRVLFLEEVQSDWHQEGRKKGYADDKITRTPPTRDEIAQEIYGARYADLDTVTQSAVDGELDARIHGTGGAAPATSGISYVPPAPFAKTWHELAMKRMLRYAAENGYDKVAWTTGEQQNERYNLSKHIESIGYHKRGDLFALTVWDKKGKAIYQNQSTTKQEVENTIGKEMLQKMEANVGRRENGNFYIEGLDLKVGGEGMKGFYDTILPAFVNKYAKKWGAKVGTADIRTEALNRTPGAAKADTVSVHAIDVTPAMKESVLTGQPMFSRQDKTAHRRPHRLGDVELDEMVQQLAALLKGVKIVKHGNEIRLKTRSGEEVRIESAEQIDPDTIALAIKKHYSQDKKQTPQSGAGVAGMYSAGKITLVEDVAGIWTLSHEFYHFLEDIGAISNADKATLNRKIAYLVTSQPETYGYLQERSLPEQRADYVGRTLTGMYDATTPTGTILARIREVIDRILNALGIRTARGILRDIETGKIYKDQGERNKGQEKGKTPLLRQDIDNIRERAYTYGEGGKHETSVSDSGFDGEGSRQYPGRDAALRFQPTVVGREKKGSIPAAGRIVRTPHDAAKIAATYLNKYPDEHMISLVLDAKGKVISVYHHTSGLPGNSQASMPILAGEAMNTPGASSIIVAHNHPSQNAEFSPEDRAFARQLNNLLTGSGVTMRDFLAVAQKQYSSYSENMLVYVDDSVDINSARSGVKIPIVGRIFESVRSPLLKVSSAEDALPLAQQYIPDGGTLILDGQNALAGFSTIQNYGRIRGDAQRAILQDIEKRNGRAMIVYSPGRIVGTAESFNLGKFIAATGGQVRLLDIIDSSGSHADNGDMPAIPTADSSLFLSVAEDVTEKAADAVGRKVSRAVDLITGRVSPEKRETLSALRKSWAEFWRPFSTVTNGEEVLARRYESMGNVAKAVRFIETMKAELDQFPPETKKDIFWYLNGDIPLTVLPEDAQTFAKNIHRRTEIIGEMLVDRGLLTEETFEAHKGTYVHYLYAKHIVGEDAPVGITSSGKLDLSYTLRRNPDLTMQQRKELGLIDDASVAVPVGMGKALTDIAKFDYLETIAENPDWVWQPSVVRVAVGKKLKTPVMGRTRRYVMMGIGKLQEQVRTYDEMMRTRPTTEVAEIHKILTDAWQKEQAKTQNAPADFVQLPNTRGYGPLAGAFVKKPIADDLRPVMDVNTDRGKLLNTVLEIERQGMAAFKMGKVALNIPTACRNIVSNIIQNNMRGRALAKIPGDIVAACQSMKARDAHYEEAFGMGLFHTNWFVTEINDVLQEFRKIESGRIDQILSAVKNVAKYYGRIDDISKFAIFLQMRKAGAPIDKAAIEAMKWGMDYSLTSRSIKGLRQTIMPFATYQYKIAPLIAESLRKRPWVLAKFALIYPAAKLAAMALHDLDDDDWEDLEKQLPAYIKKSGSMMILPWKTDQDQWQWVNLEYYFPFGNMLAIFRDAKALDSGEALRDLGISNPFLSMFYTGLSAREDSPPLHAYSGIPIYNELDPGWMKAAKYLEYMANTWLPGMLTRQGALGYTGKAIAGGEDRWGREVSFGQALGRWFGFNIVSVSPEQSRAQVAVKIQDLHKEMARIEADPSRSDEAKAEYRARMNEELSQMAEQAPAAVLPITKAKGPDPVYDALRTMAARGILHTGPPSRTLEIGGIPRKMTLEQYREYLDRSSDIARRKLAALVTSPSWETMTDERKTQVVSGIVANARKAIRQKIKAQLAREFRGQQFRPQNSEKRS